MVAQIVPRSHLMARSVSLSLINDLFFYRNASDDLKHKTVTAASLVCVLLIATIETVVRTILSVPGLLIMCCLPRGDLRNKIRIALPEGTASSFVAFMAFFHLFLPNLCQSRIPVPPGYLMWILNRLTPLS
jgi:hypothetical protein